MLIHADQLATEAFRQSIEAAIRINGQITREELLDAVFCAMDDAVTTLISQGLIEVLPCSGRMSHLDIFRIRIEDETRLRSA